MGKMSHNLDFIFISNPIKKNYKQGCSVAKTTDLMSPHFLALAHLLVQVLMSSRKLEQRQQRRREAKGLVKKLLKN